MNDRSLLKIGIFIVVVIILLSIVVLFFPFELNPYGRRATIVRSDSMQPVMGRGDIVLLSEKDPESIEEGDIIAVSVPEHYQENYGYPPTIIHRVMEIEEVQGQLYFNTKGDDNTQRDIFRTSSRNVIGYYTDTRIPSIGLLFMFANSIMGMLTLFSAFILIVIAVYFPWYLEKKEEEHETIERLRKGLGKIEEAIVVKWKNIKMKISDEDPSIVKVEEGDFLQEQTVKMQDQKKASSSKSDDEKSNKEESKFKTGSCIFVKGWECNFYGQEIPLEVCRNCLKAREIAETSLEKMICEKCGEKITVSCEEEKEKPKEEKIEKKEKEPVECSICGTKFTKDLERCPECGASLDFSAEF